MLAVVGVSFRDAAINVLESDVSIEVCIDTHFQLVSRVIDIVVTSSDLTALGKHMHRLYVYSYIQL